MSVVSTVQISHPLPPPALLVHARSLWALGFAVATRFEVSFEVLCIRTRLGVPKPVVHLHAHTCLLLVASYWLHFWRGWLEEGKSISEECSGLRLVVLTAPIIGPARDFPLLIDLQVSQDRDGEPLAVD